MLQDRYPVDFLENNLLPLDQWQPFPPAVDRAAWDGILQHALQRERKAWLVGQAESLAGKPWPDLPATLFADIMRTGSRANYQTPYFARRRNLATLVTAECFEHEGRFVDDVANGLWAIAQEPTWVIPAHVRPLVTSADPERADVFPHPDVFTVDLFAAETAMVLAESLYLLRSELNSFSEALAAYVKDRVLTQVIEPVESRDDFGSWWRSRANWNPWCSSNCLGAAMLLIDDPRRLARLTHRLIGFIDTFLDAQPEDGGCTEGPGYWNVAAGCVLVFLELLHSRTQGAMDIYNEPRVRALGAFIARVHLDGPYFANFSDCPPVVTPKRAVVYRYGERIGSKTMQMLSLCSMQGHSPRSPVWPPVQQRMCGGDLTHMLREIFWMPPDRTPEPLPRETHVWFPDIQVMVARETADPGEGLVLAAKAGHNGEKHNHNDVGHFILLHKGRPVIVDIGVEVYTRATFSSSRYSIWCIRGSGHNAPVINGIEQSSGAEHTACRVTCSDDDASSLLSLGLEGAYEDTAGLARLQRDVQLQRRPDSCVTVTDTYAFASGPGRLALTLYTPLLCVAESEGRMRFDTADIVMECEPGALHMSTDTVPLTDERLRNAWGPTLTRLVLTHTAEAREGHYSLTFRASEHDTR